MEGFPNWLGWVLVLLAALVMAAVIVLVATVVAVVIANS